MLNALLCLIDMLLLDDVTCVLAEVMATLHLDSQLIGHTAWKACSQQCWDQRFVIELDKVWIIVLTLRLLI